MDRPEQHYWKEEGSPSSGEHQGCQLVLDARADKRLYSPLREWRRLYCATL